LIPTKVSIPEEREPLICTVDVKGWSLAHQCLCKVSGTRPPSVTAAMARSLGPVDVTLAVMLRPGAQATMAWGSSTSLVRRSGRSLSLFHSIVWIATFHSSGLSRSCSNVQAASLNGDHLCRDCDGTGWVPYRSETTDGEFEEAYRLCPKGHAPRYCMRSSSGHLCHRPATVRCGPGYYCKEHIVVVHESRDIDDPFEAI
jgi:hypothetical protein